MSAKHLTTYLKDHFAGSVAALELLDHLIFSHCGKSHEQFFVRLRQEVSEDQEVLRKILDTLGADDSALRNTAAFFGEKLARVKLKLEDHTGGQLARLENSKHLPWELKASVRSGVYLQPSPRRYQPCVTWT